MKYRAREYEVIDAWELDEFNWGQFEVRYGATTWGTGPDMYMHIQTPNGPAKTFLGDVVAEFPDGTVRVYEPDEFTALYEEVEV